jgi:DNA polymerase I-like protein with 3'-5' exonuclease and polymerase domains
VNKDWKKIYFKIHLPLIQQIIPDMENRGIIDLKRRKLLRAYYEIEGQRNGRLKCPIEYSSGYNPHSIMPEQRDTFRAIGSGNWFMYLDFCNMEVSVLQWLSQDPKLAQLLNESEDFYSAVFEILMGKTCLDKKMRDFAKKIFLPVVYGMSGKTISERFNISENFGVHLVNRLHKVFPVCMSFVKAQQDNRVSIDVLGRSRLFEEQFHRIRNFIIQSPSATVCLEKLIDLYYAIKNTNAQLAFHVHDGYCLYVQKKEASYIAAKAVEILQSPSLLLQGLQLRTTCKMGETLADILKEKYESKKESV